MLAGQQPPHPRLGQHSGQEFGSDVALQKPVAVLGKARMSSHRIIDANADKPQEQEVEFQPPDQLALRTNRVERL
jgi:hypothetical protein